MAEVFTFQRQLAVGKIGEDVLSRFFVRRGWDVVDVSSDKHWRRRDVDVLVNGTATEIKTDTHKSGNLFLEISSANKPGCVFTSRAELWCYILPRLNALYIIRLPALQYWLFQHASEYPIKRVPSRSRKNVWYSEGVAVPAKHLEEAEVATLFSLDSLLEGELAS